MYLSRFIHGSTHDRQIHLTHTAKFEIHAYTLCPRLSRLLDELFALFYLLIMHIVLINANPANVLMMSNCALGIIKFCSALLTVPTFYSTFQYKMNH